MNSNFFRSIGFGLLVAIGTNASAQDDFLPDPLVLEPVAPASASSELAETLVSATSMTVAQNETVDQRIARLEAQLEQLRAAPSTETFALQEPLVEESGVSNSGLFGSVELTILKPYLSGAPAAFGLATSRVIDPNYSTGLRYTVGYVNESGLGVRGRYWNFDNNANFVPPFAPSTLGIRLDVADAEVTFGQRLCNWDLEVSGGVRYGKLQYSNGSESLYKVGSLTFEGVGPTASLSGRRILGASGLSLFGNVRGSMLMGHVNNGSMLTYMPAGSIENEIMTIAENQLGVAWTRNLNNTWQFEVRGAWETQFWMSSMLSDDVYGIGSNLALAGPSVAFELRY